MENHCNALFFTEQKLANHEKFCHSEHPLGGGDASGPLKEIPTREAEVEVETMKVNERMETDDDKVSKMMMKMSSAFFGEFLGKGRDFGAGTETEVVAEEGKLQ